MLIEDKRTSGDSPGATFAYSDASQASHPNEASTVDIAYIPALRLRGMRRPAPDPVASLLS